MACSTCGRDEETYTCNDCGADLCDECDHLWLHPAASIDRRLLTIFAVVIVGASALVAVPAVLRWWNDSSGVPRENGTPPEQLAAGDDSACESSWIQGTPPQVCITPHGLREVRLAISPYGIAATVCRGTTTNSKEAP